MLQMMLILQYSNHHFSAAGKDIFYLHKSTLLLFSCPLNASSESISEEKRSPFFFLPLTMGRPQLWVCHCDFLPDWAVAVMISMSPLCMPMVGRNSLYSPWSLRWEHPVVPGTTMLAAKPNAGRLVFLRFYGLGLPPAIEANVGHQTKRFMSRSKFDLGPPEMPLPSENEESPWMKKWTLMKT